MDPDLDAALEEAFAAAEIPQSEEFKRRFRRLVENAFISNHSESEVRRVLELVEIEEGDDE